ncbi:hypothetical protein J5N97_024775 [Dioscorea zingiberensis]|uniref:Uncharacterized protein n=1 Tax=Dioscorea zingiberensis TaxID=325984 RepID=A0A9D5C7W3_9LILI|nr:hypothetical protein J5N97_024775 [Dioscorea zingiberensis]
MHLWRVNANEFSYEDLVDCIHDMEFGKVEKMHYRVPNSGKSLETSLIILHSEESFANLAKHLKSNIPIEVYVEHAAAAKGKGKASHASTGPGQNFDSRSTNKKKAHAKSKHATATSQTEQVPTSAKGKGKEKTCTAATKQGLREKGKAKIAGGGKGKRKTIHLTPAVAEAGSIQDQNNAQGDDAADIQGQDNAGVHVDTVPIKENENAQREGKRKKKQVEGKSEHVGVQTRRSKITLEASGFSTYKIDTITKNSESSKKRQRDIKSGGERKLRLRKADESDLL